MDNSLITPKTRIYDLLEVYPELEEVLIASAPPFNKLKNPLLRRTITKVTTLSQAAAIGGIRVEDLVNRLREEAGLDLLDSAGESGVVYNTERPDWFREESVVDSIDIRLMLEQGEQPLHEVLSSLRKIKSGNILKLVAPFLPAPLIDKSLSLGFQHWVDKKNDEYHLYFIR